MSEVVYRVQSPCECQALLEAELDENRNVVRGWARFDDASERAPANSVGPERSRFDVVWQCPMCGRDTLRMFYAGALRRLPALT